MRRPDPATVGTHWRTRPPYRFVGASGLTMRVALRDSSHEVRSVAFDGSDTGGTELGSDLTRAVVRRQDPAPRPAASTVWRRRPTQWRR